MKIGCDIVNIPRMEKALQSAHFKETVFTEKEINYCRHPQSFAGLYAAKEAYLKALGCGIDRKLNEVEITHNAEGKPCLVGVEHSNLSISHDGDYAMATVILW